MLPHARRLARPRARGRPGGVDDLRALTGSFEAGTLHLDPFPLAGATTFTLPCRFIPKRRYQGDADLAVEAASARFEDLKLKVAG